MTSDVPLHTAEGKDLCKILITCYLFFLKLYMSIVYVYYLWAGIHATLWYKTPPFRKRKGVNFFEANHSVLSCSPYNTNTREYAQHNKCFFHLFSVIFTVLLKPRPLCSPVIVTTAM